MIFSIILIERNFEVMKAIFQQKIILLTVHHLSNQFLKWNIFYVIDSIA